MLTPRWIYYPKTLQDWLQDWFYFFLCLFYILKTTPGNPFCILSIVRPNVQLRTKLCWRCSRRVSTRVRQIDGGSCFCPVCLLETCFRRTVTGGQTLPRGCPHCLSQKNRDCLMTAHSKTFLIVSLMVRVRRIADINDRNSRSISFLLKISDLDESVTYSHL